MRKWRCCRKALCQRTLNRTRLGRCGCFRSGGHSEIGPFPTKRSNYVSTLIFWFFRFVTSEEARVPTHPSGLSAWQRKMVQQHPKARNFLSRNETVFSDIHRPCDSLLSRAPLSLEDPEVGTPVFTAEGEKLWCYFHLRKPVRGREEQKKLEPSPVRTINPVCEMYRRGSVLGESTNFWFGFCWFFVRFLGWSFV